ncbi:hypothetical protein [Streptomyces sp. 2323.1]|uniref:hypothetical protein n=1 Tax=Streptomyces sp. 2323.1 TaxID=1938841 RepID=UPI001331A43C|nr:hypothetical protein [Streptomyces sp. 2323.1]
MDIVERIAAINFSEPEPERPAGVDPADTWRVPVGVIYVADHREIDIVRTINETHAESPGLLGLVDYRPEPEPVPLACPQCGVAEELTLEGRWGGPATVICPCGHQWPLIADNPAWSARQMQRAILRTIQDNGLPGERR